MRALLLTARRGAPFHAIDLEELDYGAHAVCRFVVLTSVSVQEAQGADVLTCGLTLHGQHKTRRYSTATT